MTETQTLIQSLGEFSYLGIFGISILANVVVPVPEEVVLLALGYVAYAGSMNIFFLIPIVMAGLLVSDIVMYILSRKHNRLITRFYERFFAKRLAGREAWLEAHIEKVIFFSRFLVQLRFLGPFMAGQRNVSWRKFLTYELAALVIYVPLVLWAGWYFRGRIENIVAGIGLVRNIIFIALGIALLISISKYIYNRTFKAR